MPRLRLAPGKKDVRKNVIHAQRIQQTRVQIPAVAFPNYLNRNNQVSLIPMFFKKERDRDFDDIKDEVIEDEPVRLQPQIRTREEMPTHQDAGAPLFVKVDKYRDLIASVQELKLYLGATRSIFALFTDLEAVRAESLNVLRATVQRLERTITEMDTELLRPRGVSVPEQDAAEVHHIENSLNDLHQQLHGLKRELQGLK